MRIDLNRNVIVTGASRGIGKALVESFVREGDNVWACCRRIDDNLKQWADDLSKDKQWVKLVEMDLLDEEQITNGMKTIIKEHLPINILVNCAGIGHMGLFQMTSFEEIRRIYEVNLFAVMKICQMVIRPMSKQKNGHIINISSTAANEVYVGNSIYGASKSAVVAFTKSLASELAPIGIRVNSVAPGLTDTDMSLIFEGANPEMPLERSAIGRKLTTEEIAEVVVGLTQDCMSMINGQMICVNGGSK